MDPSNAFVEMYEAEDVAKRVIANAEGWRRRFSQDASHSRSMAWWNPFRRGHWSWTVTRDQYRRFVKAEDPMAAYPDEIFDGWVYDGLLGAGRDEQKRVYDGFVATLAVHRSMPERPPVVTSKTPTPAETPEASR